MVHLGASVRGRFPSRSDVDDDGEVDCDGDSDGDCDADDGDVDCDCDGDCDGACCCLCWAALKAVRTTSHASVCRCWKSSICALNMSALELLVGTRSMAREKCTCGCVVDMMSVGEVRGG